MSALKAMESQRKTIFPREREKGRAMEETKYELTPFFLSRVGAVL